MRANSDLFYIATIGISIAYRGVSGLAHRPLTNHNPRPLPAEDDTEYLLVHNARRVICRVYIPKPSQFCEGGTILEAACEKPLEHAIKSCADTGECTFLCHTAKKPFARRNASDTEPQESDAGIPNSSATWLCSGSGWTALYPKNGWITAIKGSVVRNLCKAFTVWLNQTAVSGFVTGETGLQECPKGNTIDIARDLTPDEASLLAVSSGENQKPVLHNLGVHDLRKDQGATGAPAPGRALDELDPKVLADARNQSAARTDVGGTHARPRNALEDARGLGEDAVEPEHGNRAVLRDGDDAAAHVEALDHRRGVDVVGGRDFAGGGAEEHHGAQRVKNDKVVLDGGGTPAGARRQGRNRQHAGEAHGRHVLLLVEHRVRHVGAVGKERPQLGRVVLAEVDEVPDAHARHLRLRHPAHELVRVAAVRPQALQRVVLKGARGLGERAAGAVPHLLLLRVNHRHLRRDHLLRHAGPDGRDVRVREPAGLGGAGVRPEGDGRYRHLRLVPVQVEHVLHVVDQQPAALVQHRQRVAQPGHAAQVAKDRALAHVQPHPRQVVVHQPVGARVPRAVDRAAVPPHERDGVLQRDRVGRNLPGRVLPVDHRVYGPLRVAANAPRRPPGAVLLAVAADVEAFVYALGQRREPRRLLHGVCDLEVVPAVGRHEAHELHEQRVGARRRPRAVEGARHLAGHRLRRLLREARQPAAAPQVEHGHQGPEPQHAQRVQHRDLARVPPLVPPPFDSVRERGHVLLVPRLWRGEHRRQRDDQRQPPRILRARLRVAVDVHRPAARGARPQPTGPRRRHAAAEDARRPEPAVEQPPELLELAPVHRGHVLLQEGVVHVALLVLHLAVHRALQPDPQREHGEDDPRGVQRLLDQLAPHLPEERPRRREQQPVDPRLRHRVRLLGEPVEPAAAHAQQRLQHRRAQAQAEEGVLLPVVDALQHVDALRLQRPPRRPEAQRLHPRLDAIQQIDNVQVEPVHAESLDRLRLRLVRKYHHWPAELRLNVADGVGKHVAHAVGLAAVVGQVARVLANVLLAQVLHDPQALLVPSRPVHGAAGQVTQPRPHDLPLPRAAIAGADERRQHERRERHALGPVLSSAPRHTFRHPLLRHVLEAHPRVQEVHQLLDRRRLDGERAPGALPVAQHVLDSRGLHPLHRVPQVELPHPADEAAQLRVVHVLEADVHRVAHLARQQEEPRGQQVPLLRDERVGVLHRRVDPPLRREVVREELAQPLEPLGLEHAPVDQRLAAQYGPEPELVEGLGAAAALRRRDQPAEAPLQRRAELLHARRRLHPVPDADALHEVQQVLADGQVVRRPQHPEHAGEQVQVVLVEHRPDQVVLVVAPVLDVVEAPAQAELARQRPGRQRQAAEPVVGPVDLNPLLLLAVLQQVLRPPCEGAGRGPAVVRVLRGRLQLRGEPKVNRLVLPRLARRVGRAVEQEVAERVHPAHGLGVAHAGVHEPLRPGLRPQLPQKAHEPNLVLPHQPRQPHVLQVQQQLVQRHPLLEADYGHVPPHRLPEELPGVGVDQPRERLQQIERRIAVKLREYLHVLDLQHQAVAGALQRVAGPARATLRQLRQKLPARLDQDPDQLVHELAQPQRQQHLDVLRVVDGQLAAARFRAAGQRQRDHALVAQVAHELVASERVPRAARFRRQHSPAASEQVLHLTILYNHPVRYVRVLDQIHVRRAASHTAAGQHARSHQIHGPSLVPHVEPPDELLPLGHRAKHPRGLQGQGRRAPAVQAKASLPRVVHQKHGKQRAVLAPERPDRMHPRHVRHHQAGVGTQRVVAAEGAVALNVARAVQDQHHEPLPVVQPLHAHHVGPRPHPLQNGLLDPLLRRGLLPLPRARNELGRVHVAHVPRHEPYRVVARRGVAVLEEQVARREEQLDAQPEVGHGAERAGRQELLQPRHHLRPQYVLAALVRDLRVHAAGDLRDPPAHLEVAPRRDLRRPHRVGRVKRDHPRPERVLAQPRRPQPPNQHRQRHVLVAQHALCVHAAVGRVDPLHREELEVLPVHPALVPVAPARRLARRIGRARGTHSARARPPAAHHPRRRHLVEHQVLLVREHRRRHVGHLHPAGGDRLAEHVLPDVHLDQQLVRRRGPHAPHVRHHLRRDGDQQLLRLRGRRVVPLGVDDRRHVLQRPHVARAAMLGDSHMRGARALARRARAAVWCANSRGGSRAPRSVRAPRDLAVLDERECELVRRDQLHVLRLRLVHLQEVLHRLRGDGALLGAARHELEVVGVALQRAVRRAHGDGAYDNVFSARVLTQHPQLLHVGRQLSGVQGLYGLSLVRRPGPGVLDLVRALRHHRLLRDVLERLRPRQSQSQLLDFLVVIAILLFSAGCFALRQLGGPRLLLALSWNTGGQPAQQLFSYAGRVVDLFRLHESHRRFCVTGCVGRLRHPWRIQVYQPQRLHLLQHLIDIDSTAHVAGRPPLFRSSKLRPADFHGLDVGLRRVEPDEAVRRLLFTVIQTEGNRLSS
ncbi:PAN domain protein [Babesia caballi]|uniref:PAN domain protein n=1 Tax=Babesia caballi TaxID=5871 RepID=A0AAV4LYR8_BABCB|nr:PAN domain protein [Babesia caballi]